MRSDPVNTTHATIEIHPYVQGRLRALLRQDESTGILIGHVEDGVTHITGFKRASPNVLLQAAQEAGAELAGMYRLQVSQPEDEKLWRQAAPEGRSVYLVVRSAAEGAVARVREADGRETEETVLLDGQPHVAQAPVLMESKILPRPVMRVRMAEPVVPRRAFAVAAAGVAAAVGTVRYRTAQASPAPSAIPELVLDLHSRDGELVAAWDQQGTPKEQLVFATLAIQDGGAEQTVDLSRNYTNRGRMTVRPQSRDIVITLRVQYAGLPLLSRSATYVGFTPPKTELAAAPSPAAMEELHVLRRRNKELEEAVGALRKHFLP